MSDTPLTDAEILVSTGEAVVAQLDLVSANHARRLEKALKVAEDAIEDMHQTSINYAAAETLEPNEYVAFSQSYDHHTLQGALLEKKREAISTIAKLKETA